MTTMIGWHFSRADETLGYSDGRRIIVGETHWVEPPIELCARGLHASKDLLDALSYAPGPILHKVELSGQIIHGDDKSVATHRKYLARLDCSALLHQFARACALSVVHLWEPSDDVMHFLLGDELKMADAARDARAAAWDAARDARAAARAAAMAAARAAWAAWDAARDARAAAWDAAWDAARDARAAARAAAMAAAWDEQSRVLTEHVLDAMGQGETA